MGDLRAAYTHNTHRAGKVSGEEVTGFGPAKPTYRYIPARTPMTVEVERLRMEIDRLHEEIERLRAKVAAAIPDLPEDGVE